jgi:ABC-2 type transport system ATP-binding protein
MASDPRAIEPDSREPAPNQPDPEGEPSTSPRDPGFTVRDTESAEVGAADGSGAPAPSAEAVAPAGPDASAASAASSASAGSAAVAAAPTTSDESLVVLMRDVSRRFEDRTVLRGVDLTVPRGTILGIIGPSGAGKTTTIRMLTGALAASEGDVVVMGHDPKRFHRAQRERIGYMPQSFTLYEDLTAGENVDFVASLFGMLFRRRRSRVREVLHVVDLWEARGRQAGRLSGGMQRRLALACALVHEPELIILDEPTAGIDPLLRGAIWDELHRLRDAGRTLLVTTQHVSEADECDSVAMIVGGEIVALAPPNELRRMATHGDLLDIETESVFDGTDLVGMEGVREITQDGPRHFRVVVDDAGSALPTVVEKIKSSGAEVASAREHRLSFDEIFAILVARHKQERGADADVAVDGEAAA